ncbi:MAG TPA: hypothetical protein VGI03_00995 [Verrucomicrobiae bacterium]|jgi:hypothetical protein
MERVATKQTAGLILVFLLLCSLHLWGYAHLPNIRTESDSSFANIILHNWHEYGYWHLHGQLVANPGGLNAGENPVVYPGHRPYLLLPPYWFKELPGAAGGNGLLYDFVMLLATFTGLICLLGTGLRGVLLASITCFCPGFIHNIVSIDLTSFPELFGLAVLPFVAGRLTDSAGKPAGRVLALVVMVLYMLMNWSTVFPLFVMAIYLCAKRPDQWKKLAVYLGVAAAAGLAILAVSLVSRHQAGTTIGGFWNAYLWGPGGYDGNGMTFGKALVRISAVSVIAWLPLVAGAVALCLRNGLDERWRLSALPLAAGLAMAFMVRNHSAHHPWLAICVIGLGLVFSLELLIAPQAASKPAFSSIGVAIAATFALAYCAGWSALDEFNTRNFNSLFNLLAQNTPRHCFIVVTDNLTLDGRMKPEGFSSMVDRKVLSVDDWESQKDEIAHSGMKVFFLTHGTLPPGANLNAQSQCAPKWTDRLITPLFDFYRGKISRRASGDRKVFFTEYRLYEL